MVNMDSLALTTLSNSTLTNVTTSIVDYMIPAGSWHAVILALLLYCPPFYFAALALVLDSRNPAESQRRGLWVVLANIPWLFENIINGQLSWYNALKQQAWQVFAAATDSWSRHQTNADYEYGMRFTDFASHSLPFAWGYLDVAKPEDLIKKVNMKSTHLRYISAKRGRVEKLSLDYDYRTLLNFNATLRTSSQKNPAPGQNEVAGQHEGQQDRQYDFAVTVHPIPSYQLVLSWRDSIFKASVIIGLWMAAYTCEMGKRSLWGLHWLAVCTLVGWIVQSTMVSTDEEQENILSVLPEVGRKIIGDDSLAEVGGGVLSITVMKASEEKKRRKGKMSVRLGKEEGDQSICAKLQVQWRKPGLPPVYPRFGVFCGPLFPSLSVHRYLYSIIMVLSGTLSPSIPSIRTNFETIRIFVTLMFVQLIFGQLIFGPLSFRRLTLGDVDSFQIGYNIWTSLYLIFFGVGVQLLISVRRIMSYPFKAEWEGFAEMSTFFGCMTGAFVIPKGPPAEVTLS
ncbi:hypothetical protein TRVA0_082S00364 [Trichomonascus vanleenenianus]|uniref:uncharacterized protein n=1 Tax=Trichomonascus vanleenenianus TaxID=2268995 RepID=UPI003ECB5269